MSEVLQSTPVSKRKPSPSERNRPENSSFETSRPEFNLSLNTATMVDITTFSGEKRAMTPKLEVMMKREMKKKLEEEQYTFKPKVNTSDFPSPERGSGTKRFEALYEDAKKRKETKPDRDASISAVVDKDLTFHPILSTTASVSGASDGIPPQKAVNITDVINRLYTPEVIKNRKVSEEVKEEPKPKISKRAQSLDRSILLDIGDRLYNQSKVQEEKLKKLKEVEDLKASTEYTFAPKLTSKSRSLSASRIAKLDDSPKDIGERLQKYDEIKNKKLQAAAEERKKQEALETTFKPQINPSSKRFATPTRTGDLFERLSKPVDKEGLAAKQIAELESSFFQPQLLSKRSPSVSSMSVTGESVHDRLFKEAEQQRLKLEKEREQREVEKLKDATFNPKINSRAEEIQSDKTVFERLATNKHYVHEVLSQLKSDMELAECTFKPQINRRPGEETEVNKSSADTIHLRLLAEGERLRQEKKRREEELLKEESKELTFKPELASNYQIKRNDSEPIYLRLNAEGEKIRLEQKKREEEAILEQEKGLTFAPNIPSKSRVLAQRSMKDINGESGSAKHYETLTAAASFSTFKPKPESGSTLKITPRKATPQKFSTNKLVRQNSNASVISASVDFGDIYENPSVLPHTDKDKVQPVVEASTSPEKVQRSASITMQARQSPLALQRRQSQVLQKSPSQSMRKMSSISSTGILVGGNLNISNSNNSINGNSSNSNINNKNNSSIDKKTSDDFNHDEIYKEAGNLSFIKKSDDNSSDGSYGGDVMEIDKLHDDSFILPQKSPTKKSQPVKSMTSKTEGKVTVKPTRSMSTGNYTRSTASFRASHNGTIDDTTVNTASNTATTVTSAKAVLSKTMGSPPNKTAANVTKTLMANLKTTLRNSASITGRSESIVEVPNTTTTSTITTSTSNGNSSGTPTATSAASKTFSAMKKLPGTKSPSVSLTKSKSPVVTTASPSSNGTSQPSTPVSIESSSQQSTPVSISNSVSASVSILVPVSPTKSTSVVKRNSITTTSTTPKSGIRPTTPKTTPISAQKVSTTTSKNMISAEELFKKASMTTVPLPVKPATPSSGQKIVPPKPGVSPNTTTSSGSAAITTNTVTLALSSPATVSTTTSRVLPPKTTTPVTTKLSASPRSSLARELSLKKAPLAPEVDPKAKVVPRRKKSTSSDTGSEVSVTESIVSSIAISEEEFNLPGVEIVPVETTTKTFTRDGQAISPRKKSQSIILKPSEVINEPFGMEKPSDVTIDLIDGMMNQMVLEGLKLPEKLSTSQPPQPQNTLSKVFEFQSEDRMTVEENKVEDIQESVVQENIIQENDNQGEGQENAEVVDVSLLNELGLNDTRQSITESNRDSFVESDGDIITIQNNPMNSMKINIPSPSKPLEVPVVSTSNNFATVSTTTTITPSTGSGKLPPTINPSPISSVSSSLKSTASSRSGSLSSTIGATVASAAALTDGPPAGKVLRGGSRRKQQQQSLEESMGPLESRGEG